MYFKEKRIIKKISAIFLVLLIAISNTIPTSANGTIVGDNTGGGQASMGSHVGDFRAWSQTRQGYRFYIINQDFIRVSPVYDFCFVAPTNIGEWCRFPC